MAYTTIRGSLSAAVNGLHVAGSIKITWPTFTDGDGGFHPAGSSVAQIAGDGTYNFILAANADALPGGTRYTASYSLQGFRPYGTDTWIVPASTVPLSIPQIRLNQSVQPPPFAIRLEQLTAPLANIGDVPMYGGAAVGFVPTTVQGIFGFTFAGQTLFVIPQTMHGQGTTLFVQAYDTDGNQLDPAINVDPALGDVTIQFGSPVSGSGVIYGGLGRSLPNFSAAFVNQSVVLIPASQHRFNTPNLAVVVYDQVGNQISASVRIDSALAVNVTLEFALTFRVVILGLLGANPPFGIGPIAPYVTDVGDASTADIDIGTHGQGPLALLFGFDDQTPANVVGVNYSRDFAGNLSASFDAAFTGSLEVVSGFYTGKSSPYLQAVKNQTVVVVMASAHGQGLYGLAYAFSNDPTPLAVACQYTRDSAGNIQFAFSPAFSGFVEIITAGQAGSTLYLQPVVAQTSVNISAGVHRLGTNVLAAAFTNDIPAQAVTLDYARDSSGNVYCSFSGPFTGTLQLWQPA